MYARVKMGTKLLALCLLCQLSSSFTPIHSNRWADDLPETFDWTSIKPRTKLRYTPCYDGFECARFTVPLDWTDLSPETYGNEVVLAVARLPAKVNESDSSFGGTIVLNPGGPSGSGIDILRWAGRGVQEIVDGDKHFEILSFDPRGTKYSTPSVACFEDDADRDMYLLQSRAAGSVDDSGFSLNTKWALAQGFGRICDASGLGIYPDGANIRQYVSTALVAYDMANLTDAIEEHRLHALSHTKSATETQQVRAEQYRVPLLNYWGYSYGSYLGNTFASMFPSRVGRMILDGVVDAPDYAATGWSTNLQDNDKVWLKFFEWCFEAGPKCALYNSHIRGPNALALQLDQFMDHLMVNPLSIVYNEDIYLFTYFDLTSQMHYASYGPYQVWPLLAAGLSELMQGDASTFMAMAFPVHTQSSTPSLSPSPSLLQAPQHYNFLDPFNNRSIPYPPGYAHTLEASTAILCGDGADITSDPKSSYYAYLQLLKSQSRLIGPIWAQVTLQCRHWPSSQRPLDRNRFTGPFSTKASQYPQKDDARASPLLFIGNTADPVTPVRNAFKMASQHEGARVLVQDAPGHCSGINIPSECTWGVVRRYFNEGEMPVNGAVCGVDWKPWDRE